jgi:hypothetical protein
VDRFGRLALNPYYYRRRQKARQEATLAAREAVLDRLQWQLAELRASLDRCTAAHEAMHGGA